MSHPYPPHWAKFSYVGRYQYLQYSGYYYSQARRTKLWERYGHDRVIRDDMELAMTIGYVVANPVTAGLVKHPRDYPFLGSTKYTLEELLQWCQYSEMSGDMSPSA